MRLWCIAMLAMEIIFGQPCVLQPSNRDKHHSLDMTDRGTFTFTTIFHVFHNSLRRLMKGTSKQNICVPFLNSIQGANTFKTLHYLGAT